METESIAVSIAMGQLEAANVLLDIAERAQLPVAQHPRFEGAQVVWCVLSTQLSSLQLRQAEWLEVAQELERLRARFEFHLQASVPLNQIGQDDTATCRI